MNGRCLNDTVFVAQAAEQLPLLGKPELLRVDFGLPTLQGRDRLQRMADQEAVVEVREEFVEPFSTLDVGVSWARTRPMKASGTVVRFGRTDTAVLREAARSFRDRAPRPDVRLHGFVRLLKREQADVDGTIGLAADVDGQRQSVVVVLEREDYERAVQAQRRTGLALRPYTMP